RVYLDPVGAYPDLVAQETREAVDAVRFLRALRDVPFGDELRLVAAGRDDGFRRCQDARAGNEALVDRLFQLDVRVLRAFGAEISDRGEAGQERRAQMIRRPRHAQGEALARDL